MRGRVIDSTGVPFAGAVVVWSPVGTPASSVAACFTVRLNGRYVYPVSTTGR